MGKPNAFFDLRHSQDDVILVRRHITLRPDEIALPQVRTARPIQRSKLSYQFLLLSVETTIMAGMHFQDTVPHPAQDEETGTSKVKVLLPHPGNIRRQAMLQTVVLPPRATGHFPE